VSDGNNPDGISMHSVADELSTWHCEGHSSTFSSLQNVQHLASFAVQTTVRPPVLTWEDSNAYTAFRFQGHRTKVEQLRCMMRAVQTEIHGLVVDLAESHEEIFVNVDKVDIHDDPRRETADYSIFTDPLNSPLFGKRDSSALEDAPPLIRLIAQTPELSRRYHVFDESTHAYQLNLAEVEAWMEKYRRLSLLFMLAFELLGGAPVRSTELTCATFCNGAGGRLRNMNVMDGRLTLTFFYNKMTSRTAKEGYVPLVWDAASSWLMIQNLAILRPAAQIFAAVLYSNSPGASAVYRTMLFPNRGGLFKVRDLTGEITKYAMLHLSLHLTLSSWRQIMIAIKRHVCQITQQLLDDPDTIDAAQAGHSFDVDQRIYGVSGNVLGGTVEALLPLYYEASRRWHVAMGVVPGKSNALVRALCSRLPCSHALTPALAL
jgi:hypothetical protein